MSANSRLPGKVSTAPLLGVAASFETPARLLAARRLAEEAKLASEAYLPVPDEELIRALEPDSVRSPVRGWTLAGGLFGGFAAFAFTIWISDNWPLVVGGKPIVSMPPFIDIAFEMTVLFGALFCCLGLLLRARLPRLRLPAAYQTDFAVDRYGLLIRCNEAEAALAWELLAQACAERIWTVVDRQNPPLTLTSETGEE